MPLTEGLCPSCSEILMQANAEIAQADVGRYRSGPLPLSPIARAIIRRKRRAWIVSIPAGVGLGAAGVALATAAPPVAAALAIVGFTLPMTSYFYLVARDTRKAEASDRATRRAFIALRGKRLRKLLLAAGRHRARGSS